MTIQWTEFEDSDILWGMLHVRDLATPPFFMRKDKYHEDKFL